MKWASDQRQRSSIGFWATLVLLLPVLYVASFGPACWFASRFDEGPSFITRAYQPLVRLWWRGEICNSRDLLVRYADFASAKGKGWVFLPAYGGEGNYVAFRFGGMGTFPSTRRHD